MLAELHHVAGGAASERGVQGSDEAFGVEGEGDTGGDIAWGELRRPLLQPAGANDAACIQRLHHMGCGGSSVEDEAADQGDPLGCFVRRISTPAFVANTALVCIMWPLASSVNQPDVPRASSQKCYKEARQSCVSHLTRRTFFIRPHDPVYCVPVYRRPAELLF